MHPLYSAGLTYSKSNFLNEYTQLIFYCLLCSLNGKDIIWKESVYSE